MKQISRISFFIYILWVLLVTFLNLRGNIAFGHGLGDLYYLMSILFITLIIILFYLRIIGKKYANRNVIYLFIIYLVMVILFYCLKLTLLRGAEYPWNGKIFL